MPEGLNKAFLIGNLGNEPELRYTQKGQAVLRCRLATNYSYADKSGERKEITDWHTVIVWGKRGEALNKVLSKGDRLGVEGRIRQRSWTDDAGKTRVSTEIVATEVLLLGSPRSPTPPEPPAVGGSAPADADIPF